jgi:serine/threonine protein kinase
VLREIDYFKAFDHPKIAQVYKICEWNDLFVLVFDCDYHTTLDSFKKNCLMNEEEIKEFTMKMLYLLRYIHYNELVFNSLTPEGIVYDSFCRDFRIINITCISKQKEQGKNYHINPGFMAPEALNLGLIKPEADIFVLGSLLCKW